MTRLPTLALCTASCLLALGCARLEPANEAVSREHVPDSSTFDGHHSDWLLASTEALPLVDFPKRSSRYIFIRCISGNP